MRKFSKIRSLRLLNIKVIMDDNEVIYEGMVDDAPYNILEMYYSKLIGSKPLELYVYSEVNDLWNIKYLM